MSGSSASKRPSQSAPQIDRNSGIGVGDEQRTVAPVPLVSLAKVRPGSDEGQQHLGNLVLHGCGKLIWIKAHGGDPSATSDAAQSAEVCCMAAQNLMLAACGMGRGTCCIGFARPWLNLCEAKSELGIPESYIPVAPIVVGYPRSAASRVARKLLEVHRVVGKGLHPPARREDELRRARPDAAARVGI